MDADLRHGEQAIEANCVLHLRADEDLPVSLALSRNRNFSNQARFEFEGAVVNVDVRDNSLRVSLDGDTGIEGAASVGRRSAWNTTSCSMPSTGASSWPATTRA